MIMKDPIVQEIHRHRAEYAKRFKYAVGAIGDDIRRCEAEAGGKFAVAIPGGKYSPQIKRPKAARGKSMAAAK
jgi:hypothetical protein